MARLKKYAIDFYKSFDMNTPLCGLVDKITSPKGFRRKDADGTISYHLHKELIDQYKGEATVVEPGLYRVMNICKWGDEDVWCHYLFIVEPDGTTYPIAEFLKAMDSTWVIDAIPFLRRFYAGEVIPSITLTPIPKPTPRRTRWESFSKK